MTTYDDNLFRLMEIAVNKGLVFNPDDKRVNELVNLMSEDFDKYSFYFCPFKKQNDPPIEGTDILCPCPELDREIAENGYCFCRLFYSTDAARSSLE